MKFRANETFFIRKGWLNKGLRCVREKPNLFTDKTESPMDILGMGANMVKSLRYWLQAVGLTSEPASGKRLQSFTQLGQIIFERDIYLEELGTLHLLQYRLASQKQEATAWYFFFNEFKMREFSREDFVAMLQNYTKEQNVEQPPLRSLNEDFQCILTNSPRLARLLSPRALLGGGYNLCLKI